MAPPNVVVILADDLGYGDLSCYRAAATQTPACDRIAREGLLLTDAHSAAAVCSPTRYSLLTGRYNWRSYLQDWVLSETMPLLIEPGRETIATYFQRHGYQTAVIGKWHLGWGRTMDAYQRGDRSIGPSVCGFDESFVVPFSHNSSESMQVFVRNGEVVGEQPRSLEDTATNLAGESVAFIERCAEQEQSFFLYFATTNVHFPITPHPRFVRPKDGEQPATDDRLPRVSKDRLSRYHFPAFVREFDWSVGEVLDALDRTGLAESTIVVVTSDNGGATRYGASNEPLRGSKGQIYEGGHRVPWLVRGPGIPAGERTAALACTVDLMPTLLAATGAESHAVDGRNLWPVWTAQSEAAERTVVHHSNGGMFAIRRGRWKLIEGLGSGQTGFEISLQDREAITLQIDPVTHAVADWSFQPKPFPQPQAGQPPGQLFDLHADPAETNDVYEQFPSVVVEMTRELDRIRRADR